MARQRVLLVDDSAEDRFLIVQALADAGLECDIDESCDADEAEHYLIQKKNSDRLPDFVLLDFRLPKGSAVDTMQRWFAKGLTNGLRIIVLSSVMPEGQLEALRKLGAWHVFEKPIDLDEFFQLGKRVKELATC